MSWRTVVISSRCKLDFKMGYMVVRGDEVRRIFMDEIAVVMVENPAVSMTGYLLSELMERKIKVIFCDTKRIPQGELVQYYGCHDTSRKVRAQIEWTALIKGAVWGEIIGMKIQKQADFLLETGHIHEHELLQSYIGQLEFQDATNREGHAAKVYFNAIFGMDFARPDETPINAALNYGYSILMAAFTREITSNGYITQLGLHHDNVFNRFNLASDIMEPFRVLIDRAVYNALPVGFDKAAKRELLDVLNEYVYIGKERQTVLNAIGVYTKSVFDALNTQDVSRIKCWNYEL